MLSFLQQSLSGADVLLYQNAIPPPSPHPSAPRSHEDRRPWQPETLPVALPCLLTTIYEGKPVMGNAVLDGEMPLELPLPLELVPLKEAVVTAPHMLQKGGYFIFSDDYVHKYPQSKVATMVETFGKQRGEEQQRKAADSSQASERGEQAPVADEDEEAVLFREERTADPTPPPAPASTANPTARKTKAAQVCDCIDEAEHVHRPLFRRQNPTAVYGQSQYSKRKFHETMDDEYPLEYSI